MKSLVATILTLAAAPANALSIVSLHGGACTITVSDSPINTAVSLGGLVALGLVIAYRAHKRSGE